MKRVFIAAIVVISLVLIGWVWSTAWNHSRARNAVSDSQGDNDRQDAGDSRAPKMEEKRFSITFRPNSGSDTQGSITMKEGGQGYVLLSTERPGDQLMMSMGGLFGGGGSMTSMIGTGEGSEIRFAGKIETAQGVVTGDQKGRLCFRKSQGDWAYVCGLGQYEEDSTVTKLGHGRTVESCFDLLASDDPILREGGARDLGRLTPLDDARRVVPKLISLLADSVQFVRRGAIEGLGLIGTPEALEALNAALATELDETTKEYFEEARTIIGACAMLKVPGAAEGAINYAAANLGKKDKIDDWISLVLSAKIADRKEEALKELAVFVASSTKQVAAAAGKLLKALTVDASETGK